MTLAKLHLSTENDNRSPITTSPYHNIIMSVQYSSNFGKVKRSLVNGEAAAIIAPVVPDLTDKIKAATPTLTGETRESIKNVQHSKFGWTIYTDLEKAIFIEFG